MAIKPAVKGKPPVSKASAAPAKAAETATAMGTVLSTPLMASAKLTISIKRRLADGAEVFIAPGIEIQCDPADLDTTQAAVNERVKGWLDALVAEFPDHSGDGDDAEGEENADEEEASEDEDGEDGLTAEDVDGMDKKALLALIKENDLEVEGAAKMKVDDLREAVKEAAGLNGDGEEDEEADEDEEGGDGDDEAGYEEDELKAMKLEELQEIIDAWEVDHPTIKKGADAKTKKAAYVKHILSIQNAEE